MTPSPGDTGRCVCREFDAFERERGLALGTVHVHGEHAPPKNESNVRVGRVRPPFLDLGHSRLPLAVLAPGRKDRTLPAWLDRDRVQAEPEVMFRGVKE